MIIQNVKGGYDFLPKEQRIRNYINGILAETFEEYGFNPVETPILCYYDMLSDKYDEGNDILKEIYKLKDQGNRDLGLRYDLTVPFAKLFALNKNTLPYPFKRYEIAKVFRDGPVKVGRDREFTQCDADVVGIEGQLIEAELLSLYVTGFKRLNIEISIKYNSRNLMNGLILECDVSEDMLSCVTTAVDKKDKLSEKEFAFELTNLGLDTDAIDKLNKYFSMSLEELTNEFKDTTNESIIKGLDELNQLSLYLNKMGIGDVCSFSSSLARGQNYYTGNVFEVYEKNGKIRGSIGAGGRYDKMVGNFIGDGETYPTVGLSFGLSSIYELLKNSPMFDEKSNIDYYIVPLDTGVECLNIANKLRELGYKVEVEMTRKKLKKSLDYANREKIQYVIIVGESEIENKQVNIKNMFDGTQTTIDLDKLDELKNN